MSCAAAPAACWPWAWVRHPCCANAPSACGRTPLLCWPIRSMERTAARSSKPTARAIFPNRCLRACDCLPAAANGQARAKCRPSQLMPEHRVVVIGAGMAGLVSALELAHQGLNVTLLDSADRVGGKVRQPWVDGAAIDSGPTVMTMRWVFDEIFHRIGTQLESELRMTALPVLARHFWDKGGSLDLYADRRESTDAVGRFAGLQEARRFEHFCQTAREVYRAL
ncbi:MAG: FAD-dependent oxidoreductase, partial [Betaproteobacteria bacterium]|nr:FAD-dependent oxidoreductase [Betaproteobacteria bacterium]